MPLVSSSLCERNAGSSSAQKEERGGGWRPGSWGAPTNSTLNHEAASVLMKILYAARMARYDLLKATNSLACKLTKWDSKRDLQLRRLVAYIWSSLGKRLVGYVSKDDKRSGLHLYTDADLGGCPDTQRSTTGVFLCIRV